jgi:hypothetical protein
MDSMNIQFDKEYYKSKSMSLSDLNNNHNDFNGEQEIEFYDI